MNGTIVLVIGIAFFSAAYLIYGRYLRRLFGIDPDRQTPAHTRCDGVDYVPTKIPVLFGHHFASIAGAGPIVGPIAALYFGWLPVLLWILIGCVFIGALHDFAALCLSVRNDGRSIGHIVEDYIGFVGRQIFLLFCWAALILVVAVFAIIVAKTFVANAPVATASMLFIAMAPVFGWLVYRRNVSILTASLIFVPLLFFFVWVGVMLPCDLVLLLGIDAGSAQKVWLIILFVYVFVASVIPVWLLLQPRDYLNSYLLYSMMLLGFLGILFTAPALKAPAFSGWTVMRGGGASYLFPILFVTVACGACSGFHSLVSSGTTSKQIDTEKHILPIGYGAMLVEGILALMAVVSVAYLSRDSMAEVIEARGPVGAFAAGLAHFSGKLGLDPEIGEIFFTLAISAFLLTTLDTATRLTRFTWQELFLPRGGAGKERGSGFFLVSNRYVATLLVVLVAGYLAMSGDYKNIWPVFGASNQLLAALTLLVITLILMKQNKNFWVTLFPMLFMMVVCMWALCSLFISNIRAETVNWTLVGGTAFLIMMAGVLAVQAVLSLKRAGSDNRS